MIQLGDGKEAGLCIEDFVNAEVLAAAFNSVLARRPDAPEDRLAPEELEPAGRASALDQWCEAHGIKYLNHAEVAQDALAIARERGTPLVEASRVDEVRRLHDQLLAATEPPER